jgi:hypothetical protein
MKKYRVLVKHTLKSPEYCSYGADEVYSCHNETNVALSPTELADVNNALELYNDSHEDMQPESVTKFVCDIHIRVLENVLNEMSNDE